ncbi:MAG: hypothetical protein AAGI91_11370 [Bacteroidota bacterium]
MIRSFALSNAPLAHLLTALVSVSGAAAVRRLAASLDFEFDLAGLTFDGRAIHDDLAAGFERAD